MEQNQGLSLPYEKFQYIGLAPDAVDALPKDVREALSSGGLTPLIMASMTFPNGKTVRMPLRLQVAPDRDGQMQLLAYPVRREPLQRVDGVNEKMMRNLMKGEVAVKVKDGITHIYQFDPVTKNVLKVNDRDFQMEKRIAEFEKVNDIELGTQQKDRIKFGQPVELNVGGEKVVVGLDLREKDGFRKLNGDMRDWKTRKEEEYDLARPDVMGYVKTDSNRWEYRKFMERFENKQGKSLEENNGRSKGQSPAKDNSEKKGLRI